MPCKVYHQHPGRDDGSLQGRRQTVGTPDAEAVTIGDETQTVELIAEEPTPDENTETTQPTETPAEPQNAPQPVELTDKAG